jgi:hypothetical protein
MPREQRGRQVVEAFEQARCARPAAVHESSFLFGGHVVRLRVVGHTLAHYLSRPFAHLQVASKSVGPPDLAIDLWDGAETGVAHPSDTAQECGSRSWTVGSGVATSFDGGRIFRYAQPSSITWLDRGAGHIVGWRASGQDLILDERSKPLPVLLGIWYFDRGIHVIHAGLVARGGSAVLVGGPKGAGKSTTTLACLRLGFDILGDDQVGLQQLEDGSFVGHSLYSGARLQPNHARHFPHLGPNGGGDAHGPGEKLLIPLSEILPERLARAAKVRAIALPRIVAATESRLRRATAGEALRRLAPSSLFTAFSPGRSGLERLGGLVQRVPSYWLELGSDVAGIPVHVAQLLDDCSGEP